MPQPLDHSVWYLTSLVYGVIVIPLLTEVCAFWKEKCYLIPFCPKNGILELLMFSTKEWLANELYFPSFQMNYHHFKKGRESQFYFKTTLLSRLPMCRIIGVTGGSQSTGNATPVVKEKPGRDSKNSLSRVSYGRGPSGKCLS